MRALLIATGYRKELEPLIQHKPSPLLKIVDKPILIHTIEFLIQHGYTQYDIVLHHLPEMIEEILNDGKRWGIEITYHLSRQWETPFFVISSVAKEWDKERILLGQADSLPHFEKLNSLEDKETDIVYIDPAKKWTGWGHFSSPTLAALKIETNEENFLSNLKVNYKKEKVFPFLSTKSFQDLAHSNFKILKQAAKSSHFPTSAHMAEKGIWLSHAVSIHPGVKIVPPVYIGENCEIMEDVQLGPEAIIESNCIIDKGSTIQHSVISQQSYVGEALNIDQSIVYHNVLIHLGHGTCLNIKDDFILSELNYLSPFHSFFSWTERLLGGFLWICFFPVFFLMKKTCPLKSSLRLKLPASYDKELWENFSLESFDPSQDSKLFSFCQFFQDLPALRRIYHGEVHFVGVPPRSPEEVEALPEDWRKLYLKSKAGMISPIELEKVEQPTSDEIYAAEALYVVHRGFMLDVKIFFHWLMHKLLPSTKKQKKGFPQ